MYDSKVKLSDLISELNTVIEDAGKVINQRNSRDFFIEALNDEATDIIFF